MPVREQGKDMVTFETPSLAAYLTAPAVAVEYLTP